MFDEEELESRKKIRTEGDDGEGEGAEEDDEEEELRDDIQQGKSETGLRVSIVVLMILSVAPCRLEPQSSIPYG